MRRNHAKDAARALFLLLTLLPSPASAHHGPCKIVPVGTPSLVVDSTWGANSGSVDVSFRSEEKEGARVVLELGHLLGKADSRPLGVTPTLTLLNAPGGAANRPDPGDPAVEFAHGAMPLLRVAIAGLVSDGAWTAQIYNCGQTIGSLDILRRPQPFHVALDLPDGGPSYLSLARDAPLSIPLRNEDDDPHTVEVTFEVGGSSLAWSERTTLSGHDRSFVVVPAASAGPWLEPPGANPLESLFRNVTADGHLRMKLLPSDGGTEGVAHEGVTPAAVAPSKVIVGPVRLSSCSELTQSLSNPRDPLRRRILVADPPHLHSQLNPVAPAPGPAEEDGPAINALPMELASRLRVSLGQQLRGSLAELSDSAAIQPGFATLLAETNKRANRLERRLGLVEQLGELRRRFDVQRAARLFPSPMRQIADRFERTVDALCKNRARGRGHRRCPGGDQRHRRPHRAVGGPPALS